MTSEQGRLNTDALQKAREELLRAAGMRETVNYGTLMELMGISRGRPLFDLILEVDRYERSKGAPGFAAIIVRKDTGYPGGGFFCDDDLPESLKRPFTRASDPKLTAAEMNYVKDEQRKVWEYYSTTGSGKRQSHL